MLTDMDYYRDIYGGELHETLGEKALERLLKRAERDIRCVCSEDVSEIFSGKATDGRRADIIGTAVCIQAESLAKRESSASSEEELDGDGSAAEDSGGSSVSSVSGVTSGAVISSVKLGDFTVNYEGGSSGSSSGSGSSQASSQVSSVETVNESCRGNVCGEAMLILDKGGMLYRGGVRV
ncbi:MAG: hypothetical protein NC078_04580 [Ruminococcus sp.]|nr:hypothetical protein [Ruminococcus sp.]